jgi:tetratricopeptide (TPR) repeat protein
MSWFTKLFGPKPLSQSDRNFFDAHDSFATGKKLFQEAVLIKGEGWKESRLVKIKEALKYFDEAIEKGFNESEVFSFRGNCLDDLGFYFEALEDYNKAIGKNPRKSIASNYFMRGMIKQSLFDFDGQIADLKEAIRLSKFDNEDNKHWDDVYVKRGFRSQTTFYEMCLPTDAEIATKKKYPEKFAEEELRKIKRRER